MNWFNFEPVFISGIVTLFNDMSLATINNGYLSPFLYPQKGLFQGNPIASYMFIIVIELLVIRLQQDQAIKGIKVGVNEILLSLFADHLAVLMEYNQHSWNAAVLQFTAFQKSTGMKIKL